MVSEANVMKVSAVKSMMIRGMRRDGPPHECFESSPGLTDLPGLLPAALTSLTLVKQRDRPASLLFWTYFLIVLDSMDRKRCESDSQAPVLPRFGGPEIRQ